MNTAEGLKFAVAMAVEPIKVEFCTSCQCGCGRPERLDITIRGVTVSIIDSTVVDRLIATLQEGRAKLWGAQ
jgi:hypothetical protein